MHTMSVLTSWSQTEAKISTVTGSSVRITWITQVVRASELEHGGS